MEGGPGSCTSKAGSHPALRIRPEASPSVNPRSGCASNLAEKGTVRGICARESSDETGRVSGALECHEPPPFEDLFDARPPEPGARGSERHEQGAVLRAGEREPCVTREPGDEIDRPAPHSRLHEHRRLLRRTVRGDDDVKDSPPLPFTELRLVPNDEVERPRRRGRARRKIERPD